MPHTLLGEDCQNPMRTLQLLATILSVGVSTVAFGADDGVSGGMPGVRAHLSFQSFQVPIGEPVMALFSIENTTDESITLTVPDADPDIPSPQMGLPLSHVFSGVSGSGVSVMTESGRRWDAAERYRKPDSAPILMIAPNSTVGTRVDLRERFSVLRSPGRYRILWRPYGGAISSETVFIQIAPLKQAEIVTDFGTMTVRFFYKDAPQHVANFIELARDGFYNSLTFHGLTPGHLIQGGCPRGDGTGIRSDGKRVPFEANGRPHRKGSVSMSLLEDDPDSGSCQFFISNTRHKDWDGLYTVFGELVGEASFATLDQLMATPVDEAGRPTRPLHLRSVRIVTAPQQHND